MHNRAIVPWMMCLLWAGPAGAQMVTTEALRALHMDSIPGAVVVYHSPPVRGEEAAELQQLMQECIAKYRSTIAPLPPVTVAVLDSVTWTRVSRAPYGIPNHNPFASPVVVMVPATAAGVFAAAVPSEQANRFFRLLALHELGHVLAFAAVGVDIRKVSMPPRWPIPGWYLEFTADYFRLSCLPPADRETGITPDWLRAEAPLVRLLDEFEHLHEKRTPEGTPYIGTAAYFLNVAWFFGVVGEAARLQLLHLGDGFLPLLREQWHRPPGNASSEAILDDLRSSNPDLDPWLRSVGAIP